MEVGDSGVDPGLEKAILSNDLSGIPDDRQGSVESWQDMLIILRTKDWDRRVRIGAGNMGGARVGSVAQVPPLGVKLALRKAMMERANAEIHAILALEELRRLREKRAVRGWIWFVCGAGTAGGLAAALKAYVLGG